MGIQLLRKFVDQNRVYDEVVLEKDILIDGFASGFFVRDRLLRKMIRDRTLASESVGPDLLAFRAECNAFIDELINGGVTPIFIFDAPGVSDKISDGSNTKLAEWKRREMDDQDKKLTNYHIAIGLENAPSSLKAANGMFFSKLYMAQLLCVLRHRQLEVTVANGEADKLLVSECVRRNAIGILGNDTDFAVAAGSKLLLIDTLTVNAADGQLTVKRITPERVCRALSLQSLQQLHLCAALTGNDFTKGDVLRSMQQALGIVSSGSNGRISPSVPAQWLLQASNREKLVAYLTKHPGKKELIDLSNAFYAAEPTSQPAEETPLERTSIIFSLVASLQLPLKALALATEQDCIDDAYCFCPLDPSAAHDCRWCFFDLDFVEDRFRWLRRCDVMDSVNLIKVGRPDMSPRTATLQFELRPDSCLQLYRLSAEFTDADRWTAIRHMLGPSTMPSALCDTVQEHQLEVLWRYVEERCGTILAMELSEREGRAWWCHALLLLFQCPLPALRPCSSSSLSLFASRKPEALHRWLNLCRCTELALINVNDTFLYGQLPHYFMEPCLVFSPALLQTCLMLEEGWSLTDMLVHLVGRLETVPIPPVLIQRLEQRFPPTIAAPVAVVEVPAEPVESSLDNVAELAEQEDGWQSAGAKKTKRHRQRQRQ
jgi:hypothetical protein